eukprot:snap_masked-scaffold_22-processed-gene-1.21-mRNA-1 protein AED:1.00 eAED:1.00 QI:0/0/0/0/1/1/3/0/389
MHKKYSTNFIAAFPEASRHHPLISTPEKQDCPICLESTPGHEIVSVCENSHACCINCAKSFFLQELQDKKKFGTNFPCPISTEENCSMDIEKILYVVNLIYSDPGSIYFQDDNLEDVVLGSLLKDSLFQLQTSGSLYRCPNQDCSYACFQDEKPVAESFIKPKVLQQLKGKNVEIQESKKFSFPGISFFSGIKNLFIGKNASKKIKYDPDRDLEEQLFALNLTETKYVSFKKYMLEKLGRASPIVTAINLYQSTDDGVDLRKFKCSSCNYSSCILCKEVWTKGNINHDEKSCNMYKNLLTRNHDELILSEKEINHNIDLGKMQKCPSCFEVIEKHGGCEYFLSEVNNKLKCIEICTILKRSLNINIFLIMRNCIVNKIKPTDLEFKGIK